MIKTNLNRTLPNTAKLICALMLTLSAGCTPIFANNNQTQTAATASAQSEQKAEVALSAPHEAKSNQQKSQSASGVEVQNPIDQPPTPAAQDIAREFDTQARSALARAAYADALTYSVSAYQAMPSDQSYATALYAASMLSPIELMHRHDSAQTPIEIAVTGMPRAHICHAQKDAQCLAHVVPNTANALEQIGRASQANALMSLTDLPTKSNRPLAAFLLPLSGGDRKIGRAMLGAALQASGLYDHSDMPFAIRFFDTQSTPNSIPAILEELRKYDTRLILGPLDIKETIAVSKSLGENEVMIGFTPNEEFTRTSQAAFQFSYAMPQEAQKIAEFIASNSITKVAVAAPNDDFTASAIKFLQTDLPTNVKLDTISYPANQTDLREQAKKVAKLSPELIYFPSSAALAERFASFLAQENLWCRLPNTPQPKAAADTRKFITCLASSTWAPVAENHSYKFIVNGIYLDYNEAAAAFAPDFANTFAALYHRAPSVMEILPFVLLKMLAQLPYSAFRSQSDMQRALQTLLHGQSFLLIPGFRQITEQASIPYVSPYHNTSDSARTLINAQ